jgi:RNA polymerase sigma factor (sigma-70 family)
VSAAAPVRTFVHVPCTNPTEDLENLYKLHHQSLIQVATSYLGNADAKGAGDASDVVSEVWIRVWKMLSIEGRVPCIEELNAWTANKSLDVLRHRKTKKAITEQCALKVYRLPKNNDPRAFVDGSSHRDQVERFDHPAVTSVTATLEKERQQRSRETAEAEALVADLLESLPDIQRQAVELHLLRKLPQAEVAQRLGIKVSTLKSHIFRAKQRMAEAGDSQ